MPDIPHKTDDDGDLDAGWGDDDSGVSERPTVAPPFDLESYAKENASMSRRGSLENRIDELFQDASQVDEAVRAPSDTAITLPPPPAAPAATAATPTGTPGGGTPGTPGSRAPGLGVPGLGVPGLGVPGLGTSAPPSDPLSRRETPQGMQQIEAARALSAREDLGTGSLLSLANMRVPSNLPPRAMPGAAGHAGGIPPGPQAPDDPVITLVGVQNVSGMPEPPGAEAPSDPQKEMQERFALGDYSGALVMAESLLDENPTHVEAREYAESCRAVLQQMYTAKIGPLDRVPVVEVAREQLRWLSIDHRAGFVLSLVDGVSSLEMILDVSGMPPLDALRILFELVQQRIISLRED